MKAAMTKHIRQTGLGVTGLLLTLGLAGGCSIRPDETSVQRGPSYVETMPSVDRIGLLVDGLVAYDELGSPKYIDVQDSVTAITNLKQQAEAALRTKGYDIAFVAAPWVGGFKHLGAPFPVAPGPNAQPREMAVPLPTPSYLDPTPRYRDILQTISYETMTAFETRGRTQAEVVQASPVAKTAMADLAAKMHVRYLFVVQGYGVMKSSGMMAVEVGFALLIGVQRAGMSGPSTQAFTHLDSYASLIDLQDATVIWSNKRRFPRFNPTDPRDYQKGWARALLYWFPPRGKLEPAPG